MKKLLMLLALSVSGSAFANYCTYQYVNPIPSDYRYPGTVRTFTEYDCKEAAKECSKELRLRNLNNRADCRQVNYPNPGPNPNPNPYPNPGPNPYPDYGYDVRRPLQIGETVYYNNRIATVLGAGYNNQYAIRTTDSWGSTTTRNGVRREDLSITNGCNQNICVNSSIINVSTGRSGTIVALTYNNSFVVRTTDSWGSSVTTTLSRQYVAETQGCTSGYNQICVGYQVLTRTNRYGTIIGIQADGRVVVRTTDSWGSTVTQTNVNPSELVITGYNGY